MKVLFIRHAESENNLQRGDLSKEQYQKIRNADPTITEKGRTQTQLLGYFLQKKKLKLKKMYCSAMVRAMETSSILQRILQVSLEIKVNIHEVGGMYKGTKGEPGKNREWISENYPNIIIPDEVTEEGWFRKEEKETKHEGFERARSLIEELKELAKETDEKDEDWLAFVTHGNFLDLLLAVLLDRKEDSTLKLIHTNTGMTGFEFKNDGSIRMLYINSADHLEESLFSFSVDETPRSNTIELDGFSQAKEKLEEEENKDGLINVVKKSMSKQESLSLDDEIKEMKVVVKENNPE